MYKISSVARCSLAGVVRDNVEAAIRSYEKDMITLTYRVKLRINLSTWSNSRSHVNTAQRKCFHPLAQRQRRGESASSTERNALVVASMCHGIALPYPDSQRLECVMMRG